MGSSRRTGRRVAELTHAHDAGLLERLGLAWLTAFCVLLGLFPVEVMEVIDPIPSMLVGRGLVQGGHIGDTFLLAPVSPERASYSPIAMHQVEATTGCREHGLECGAHAAIQAGVQAGWNPFA